MVISECLEYRALPIQFLIFTLSGVWCPDDWNPIIRSLYKFYTVIQATAGVLFWSTMLINLIVTKNNSDYFYENLFAISTLSYAMYKEVFVLIKRKQIINLLKLCFEDKWYKPRNRDEIHIIENYEYETRSGK